MENYYNVEKDNIVPTTISTKSKLRSLSSEINNFQLLCIYNQKIKPVDNDPVESLHKNIINGKITNIPVAQNNTRFNTFIIWEQSYQENEDIFINLRIAARNNLILRIGENIVVYLIKKYEEHLGAPIKSDSKLRDEFFIDQLIKKFDIILKRDTFLRDNIIWEDFCNWFRVHLTDWILEDMETSIGISRMEKLDKKELNELFYKAITESFSEDLEFVEKFTEIINVYTQDWIEKVISSMGISGFAIDEIIELLDVKEEALIVSSSGSLEIKDITFTLIDQGNLLVMSNAPYQSVREALSKNQFMRYDYTPWPTVQLSKGTLEGTVQIMPYRLNLGETLIDQTVIQKAWCQAKELSELDVDIFDALCCYFLSKAKHHHDSVEIHLDDLLSIRGLKQKLGGNGRRGGYEIDQREQVLKALARIQSLWIDLEKVVIYKKGKPIQMKLKGRAFIFNNQHNEDYFVDEQSLEKKFVFTVGEVFAQFLYGSGRQVALLPIQALQYNPYRQKWEKTLIRYLSWRWRTQARRGDYLQPHKISTLLEVTGQEMNERTPSRTRDRLEQAFDTLLQDGVIAAWHYEKWDESIVSTNGWARIWENSTVLIEPPELIKEHYRPIERNRKVQHKSLDKPKLVDKQTDIGNIGEQIRTIRKNFGFTLLQVAEELDISVSYLSNIEREIKVPSNKIQKRVTNWLDLHE